MDRESTIEEKQEAKRPRADTRAIADSYLAARVATLHFVERRTNLAIAEMLGISRFRAARLIEYALDSGIVSITISPPPDINLDLGAKLRSKYGLAEALVLARSSLSDPDLETDGLARLAAELIREIAVTDCKLGVSWGTTMGHVARAVERVRDFPRCDVVQMIGNVPSPQDALHALDVVRRFASVARGAVYPLNVPLALQTAELAKAIRSDPTVARSLAAVSNIDVAAVAVGSWNPPSSRLAEVLPTAEAAGLLKLGVQADICAVLFDEQGRTVQSEFAERAISATEADLRRIPTLVGIANGPLKVSATRAVLRAGILRILVTTEETAVGLLT